MSDGLKEYLIGFAGSVHVGAALIATWWVMANLWHYLRCNWVGRLVIKPEFARVTWFFKYRSPDAKNDKALLFKGWWSTTVWFIRLETRETSAKRR